MVIEELHINHILSVHDQKRKAGKKLDLSFLVCGRRGSRRNDQKKTKNDLTILCQSATTQFLKAHMHSLLHAMQVNNVHEVTIDTDQ